MRLSCFVGSDKAASGRGHTIFDRERRAWYVTDGVLAPAFGGLVTPCAASMSLAGRALHESLRLRGTAGQIFRIPAGQCVVPFRRSLDGHERPRDFCVLRMELGVLDAELPHQCAGSLVAIRLFARVRKCSRQHVALLEQAGPAHRPAGHGSALAGKSTDCRSRRGRC